MTAESGSLSVRFCFQLALILVTTVVAQGQESTPAVKRPIKVTDTIGMTRLETPDQTIASTSRGQVAHFSPDGKRFVVVLRRGNLEQNTNVSSLLLYQSADIFVAPKPELLLEMSSSSSREAITKIRWLNDSETLVFLGENPGEPSEVYSFDIRTRLLKSLTHLSTAIVNFDATDDGGAIVFVADPPAKKPECTEQISCKGIVINDQDLAGILEGNYSQRDGRQVFWQQLGASPLRVPVGDEYFVSASTLSLSPDGRYLIFPAFIRDIHSHPAWASYQNRVMQRVFNDNVLKNRLSPIQEYLLFDAKTTSLVPLVNAPLMAPFDPVSWARDGKSVFLLSYLPLDTNDPAECKVREQKKYPVEVKLPSGQYQKVPKEDFPRNEIREPPIDVTLEQDVNTPPKLYVSDPRSQEKILLLDLNPQFAQLSFGKVEKVTWKASDGHEELGGIYFPPDYLPGKHYPLVIQGHGFEPDQFSMDGRSEWSSAFAARSLASKGFVVLQVGPPKNGDADVYSGKYGAVPEEAAKNMFSTAIEGAIDYLSDRGVIDRNRVGIIGFSRQACFVAYTLTQSKYRFAAASLVDGISCGYFEEIAFPQSAWDFNALNGGAAPFGEGLKLWMQKAPGFNLDKVQTPVRLVAHGNSSVLTGWEWYVGLSLQKRPVDFILIPGATHILVKPCERILAQQGVVDWFSFWLKGEEDPDPAKRDQYARWRGLRREITAMSLPTK